MSKFNSNRFPNVDRCTYDADQLRRVRERGFLTMSTVKLMVCGDVGGNLEELFKKVEAVQKKSGVFDMLLCAGEVIPHPKHARAAAKLLSAVGQGWLRRPSALDVGD